MEKRLFCANQKYGITKRVPPFPPGKTEQRRPRGTRRKTVSGRSVVSTMNESVFAPSARADLPVEGSLVTAIGLISGTSMDGIDIALLRTDGERRVETGPGCTVPYPSSLRDDLQDFLSDPARAEHDPLTELDHRVTDAFTAAIAGFMQEQDLDRHGVDLIGLHGQTVYHSPARRFTRQLGLGQRMADALGVPVVDSFRQADVAAGGQGAPLVPLYHAALAATLPPPVMVLNLGGVGNVTYLDGDVILAFDTGPASALVDDLVRRRHGRAFDEGGAIARRGQVDAGTLAALMDHPFFDAPVPKSLDRNAFHSHARQVEAMAGDDAVATLSAFTVAATAAALRHVPKKPLRWLVAGGGRNNGAFMEGLSRELGVPVEPVEVLGWNGDLLEAQCFAYLAVRSVRGLPLSLPATTGVPRPMTGGLLRRPSG
jgi:anhydro-N-acetylmuramic acid kinase